MLGIGVQRVAGQWPPSYQFESMWGLTVSARPTLRFRGLAALTTRLPWNGVAAATLLATLTVAGTGLGVAQSFPPLEAGDEHHWYIVGALAIGLLEAGLIGILLFRRSAREGVERSLHRQVRLLSQIIELASSLHQQSVAGVDQWLDEWLQRLAEFLGLDRAALIEERRGLFYVTRSWSAHPAPSPPPALAEAIPWSMDRLRRGETVQVSRLAELPAEAAVDRETLQRGGVRSWVAIPLIERDWTVGALTLTSCDAERDWPAELITNLRLVGDIVASALATRRAETARAASDDLSDTLLGVLSGPTAVLDQESRIVSANPAWLRLGRAPARNGLPWTAVGGNYLDAIGRAVAAAPGAANGEVLAGMRSALAGTHQEYRCKYEWPSHQLTEMIAVPLRRPAGGAVVSYIDSTDSARAEREAQELRQSIAHFDRVAALGDLSASIAHELNQPLTAILSNVQAARRFLAADPQSLDEVREILSDIEADDRRAGELIRRLRALMRKETANWVQLLLGELVREAAGLLSSDARLRQIAIRLDLDETLPPVRGDGIQLSQVILNLLMNGADAMQYVEHGDRELQLRTWRYDDRWVGLSVRDRGTGILADPIERVFEPFYTSKPEGLGIGLSVCQTILQAHGGRIWAANNPDGGATFQFVLPVSQAEER